MNSREIITHLKTQANPANVEGMARFGISSTNTLGITVSYLRKLSKEIRKQEKNQESLHQVAQELWSSKIHEARILATLVEIPELVTRNQADDWVGDLDSWDVCDAFCLNLIDKTSFAIEKVTKWASRDEEFVRRAAFSLLAGLAVHRKELLDKDFETFFPLIKEYSTDERNFVRKAINWALRQIGKRNPSLKEKTILLAEEIGKIDSKSARWISKDALRELEERR